MWGLLCEDHYEDTILKNEYDTIISNVIEIREFEIYDILYLCVIHVIYT